MKFELPKFQRCAIPRVAPRFRDKVRPEEVRDGPVSECRVEGECDIQRQALASKFAEVLLVVLERCARLLERPCPIEEVELVELRSDDKGERRAQDRKPHRPLH